MIPFNQLSPAQAERFAILTEELGESLQIIGKALRHGMKSRNPLIEGSKTNKELLEKELGDVQNAVEMLCAAGDLDRAAITRRAQDKSVSIQPWLHHQNES
jgi:NTP pyrophosphatase (non-canonical NTP hydrolase)